MTMAATFSRTLRSLEADGSRSRVVDWLVLAVVAAWAAWLVSGRVALYEVSESARLEVEGAAHPIASPVTGRVVETGMTIGREVHAGEVLIVLDDQVQRDSLREKRARSAALAERRAALGREIQAERQALAAHRQARTTAVEASRAQVAEAEARAALAERQLARVGALRARGAASVEEHQRAQAESRACRAAARALELTTARLGHDGAVQEGDRKIRLAKLEREAVELQGEAAVEEAAIRSLEHEADRRVLRAPISGRIGAVAAEFRVGSVVREAETLGSIVPRGEPRAVALFPAAAIGRVRAGQVARLRLDGFPWTQYGTLTAQVAEVGDEAHDGLIRVELALGQDPLSAIPLGHGLPGTAEVEVERVSPATLVLRAAGQALVARRPAAAKDALGGEYRSSQATLASREESRLPGERSRSVHR
jgi:membrane fusion protein (multidrug efflux system)